MFHNTNNRLVTAYELNFTVIGAGGTGSHIISGITRICEALKKLGKEQTFEGTIYDPDIITEANAARQLFVPAETGMYKADALANRMNYAYGSSIQWVSNVETFPPARNAQTCDIIISCVDSKKSREQINRYIQKSHQWAYIIDCGNDNSFGQVLLGERKNKNLPIPYDTYPALISGKENNTASCSLAEALEKQDLFINQVIATYALQLIWNLLRKGGTEHNGYFINLATGQARPAQ